MQAFIPKGRLIRLTLPESLLSLKHEIAQLVEFVPLLPDLFL